MSSNAEPQPLVRAAPLAAAPPVVGLEGGGGLGPADAWRIIKQRKWLVILTFVLLYLLVCGVTFVVYQYFPAYTSEALIEMLPVREGPLSLNELRVEPNVIKTQLETEARKLKSRRLVGDVLKLPQVKETNFYKWYDGDLLQMQDDLASMLVSAPVPESTLVRVSLATRTRSDATLIIQKLIDAYLAESRTRTKDEMGQRSESLKETLKKKESELRLLGDDIARFRESTEAPQLESSRERTAYNLSQLQLDLSQVQLAATRVQAQLDQVRATGTGQAPLTAEMRIIIESDPVLRFWRQQVESLDIEIRVSAKTLGENHRATALLVERRQSIYEKETAKREELIDDLRQRQLEVLTQELASLNAQEGRLQDQIQEMEARQRDVDRNILRYGNMVATEERLRQEIKDISKGVTEAEHMVGDRSREVRMALVQPPIDAVKPSRPDVVFYLGGGFVLALLGSIGLAFLRELTDTAIRTPLDIIRHGNLSVLGTIPLIDDEEADVDEIEHATRGAPNSLVAEAFRRVRTNLTFSGPPESQRCLLITSPRPGDGKTAIAVNLAVTLAQGNQRVLLIDCNFRRPGVRNVFAGTRAEGLSNILIGRGRLEELTSRTELPNLDVLTSGPMPPTPSDLLGGPYMRQVIAESLARYDRVILDGPPALLISDALVLATLVDGVVLVARAVNSSKGALRRARDQLEGVNARIVGAILNGVQARAGGYFRQQYREFYDYTTDEAAPFELPGAGPPGGPTEISADGDGSPGGPRPDDENR